MWFSFESPWYLVMMDIFSGVWKPFVCLHWRSVFSCLLPIFWYDYLFCLCWVWGDLHRSLISTFCLSCHLPISYHIPWVATFISLLSPMQCRIFWFWWVPEVYFGCFFPLVWRYVLKEVTVADIEEILPMFSSRILMDSCLTLKSFIHYEFIFVYGVRGWSIFILLNRAAQFPLQHLLKRLSFFHCIFFSCFLEDYLAMELMVHIWSVYCVPLVYGSVFMPVPCCHGDQGGSPGTSDLRPCP